MAEEASKYCLEKRSKIKSWKIPLLKCEFETVAYSENGIHHVEDFDRTWRVILKWVMNDNVDWMYLVQGGAFLRIP